MSGQEFQALVARLLGMSRCLDDADGGTEESLMNCQSVRQLLYLFADTELDEELRTRLAGHLEQCSGCAAEAGTTHRVVVVLRRRCQCLRVRAPESLRIRILASLPHRQDQQS